MSKINVHFIDYGKHAFVEGIKAKQITVGGIEFDLHDSYGTDGKKKKGMSAISRNGCWIHEFSSDTPDVKSYIRGRVRERYENADAFIDGLLKHYKEYEKHTGFDRSFYRSEARELRSSVLKK